MAKVRKKASTAHAAAAVADMFGDEEIEAPPATSLGDLDKQEVDEAGPPIPERERIPDGGAPAWESFPIAKGRICSKCTGTIRETPSGRVCKRGHGGADIEIGEHDVKVVQDFAEELRTKGVVINTVIGANGESSPAPLPAPKKRASRKRPLPTAPLEDEMMEATRQDVIDVPPRQSMTDPMDAARAAAAINAKNGDPVATVVDEKTVEVRPRKVGTSRARVTFRELETTRLTNVDAGAVLELSKQAVNGAFVKVTANLRPSEREAFDLPGLKHALRAGGARAVLVAVQPVPEAPDKAAKAEVSTSVQPEAAIGAWFDGLTSVPQQDRDDAKELALALLAEVK